MNTFDEIEVDDIVQTTQLNYLSPIILIKKFNRFKRNEKGTFYVINIGSGAAYQPIDGWSMYCSTKSALSMFTRVVKEESDIHNFNLNVVDLSPGIIDTDMQAEIRKASVDEFSEAKRFVEYHQNGELQSAIQTADLIISNFGSLFKNSDGKDSLRNYK